MDDDAEIELKNICCTCLTIDRKLVQLCKISDGVNNLYFLLSYDPEAYKEGFFKDSASLHICWECRALIRRIDSFRMQVCVAQKHLSSIKLNQPKSLSCLSIQHKNTYDDTVTSPKLEVAADNFIDCSAVEVKTELDDLEDIPLAELQSYCSNKFDESSDEDYTESHKVAKDIILSDSKIFSEDKVDKTEQPPKKEKKSNVKTVKKKIRKKDGIKNKEFYKTIVIAEKEMYESREKIKMDASFLEAANRCESCLNVFKSQTELKGHNIANHTEKPDYSICDICLSYIPTSSLSEHKGTHFIQYSCLVCEHRAYTSDDIVTHLDSDHGLGRLGVTVKRKKGIQKSSSIRRSGSKPRQKAAIDQRTPQGYQCDECPKCFESPNQRWKHVQRCHREGFRCADCGKRFAFRNTLSRHQLLHSGPPPREECETCHKMIRVDLVKVHARIHAARQRFSCVACDKSFVSLASYHHHLKYTMSHSNADILKYKCSMCDKGYRSRGELRDHENYQHKGHTRHQCPICGKALATRRCITRHVKRAHDGVKESAKDKICQQCGKAFRDKKGLREHEFIHTGERPLSCEVCGCTFRQSASLYTHRKRVHKIHQPRKQVTLLDTSDSVEKP